MTSHVGVLARLAAWVGCLMLSAGCTETPTVGSLQPTEMPPPARVSGSPVSQTDLAAQKQAAGIASCPGSHPDEPPAAGGLPDVVLGCLGGGPDVRLAGLRGHPMVINIWAQWCGPCRAEAPYLAEVAQESKALMVLGVDYVDPLPHRAIEFARVSGWRYPQLVDPDKLLAAPLQMVGPPQTLFVRPDGVIAYRHSGPFTSSAQLRRLVREHLGVEP